MKNRIPLVIFVAAIAGLIVASLPASAEPPGSGAASGPGGHGSGHGRMSDDFRGVIHSLFAEHAKVERSVELTEKGYRAKTVSKDPEVAAMLQKHVAQMESRLEGGLGVRHWDPAFVELREHYDDMSINVENVDGGVAVSVIGKTPGAVKVAQNHARIISGFVAKGGEQMHATHAAVLEETVNATPGVEVAAAGGKAGGACCGKAAGCDDGAGGKGAKKEGACAADDQCGKGDKPCCAARAGKESAADESAPQK